MSQTVAKITSDLLQRSEGSVIGILNARRGNARARAFFVARFLARYAIFLTSSLYVAPDLVVRNAYVLYRAGGEYPLLIFLRRQRDG